MSLELSQKALKIKPSSTMAITELAKLMKAEGKDVISFSAGEPDFRTPEHICETAKQAIDDGLTKYTAASGLMELKQAVSGKFLSFNHLKYEPEQIVISNGGKHALSNVFTAILNEGDEVIIPAPYWVTYSESAKLAGGVPVIVTTKKENAYKLTAEEFEASCTKKTKALVLNSPNNPTGMVYTRAELEEIAKVAVAHDIYVVADEVYEYLCYEGAEHISIASLNDEIYKRTITVSGLSKGYSMTGWRIGYTGSSFEIAKLMGSIQSQQTSNPNTIAQIASIEALTGDQSEVELMKTAYNERRKYLCSRIQEIPGLSCIEPQGAFYVFVDISDFLGKEYKGQLIKAAADFARILLEEFFVAVIPCEDFGFDDHFRISYSVSMEEIKTGMNRIKEYCESLT
ncbi:MAG: pyridoxal phosphate-dependent aminotransferase [Lachnospiraceae bacterium]|nr:pyridoxal phosphate-dependent aminotransferase [Lachnospiraceae bacterium]